VLRVGSSRWFPGEFLKTLGLAGGEDYGYFASGAGDAGSNPAAGICARVSELAKRLMFRSRGFPGQGNLTQAAFQQITPAWCRLEK
jgi:hypothetical protein